MYSERAPGRHLGGAATRERSRQRHAQHRFFPAGDPAIWAHRNAAGFDGHADAVRWRHQKCVGPLRNTYRGASARCGPCWARVVMLAALFDSAPLGGEANSPLAYSLLLEGRGRR